MDNVHVLWVHFLLISSPLFHSICRGQLPIVNGTPGNKRVALQND